MPVVPPKLQPGSSVRVIAPSRSLAIIDFGHTTPIATFPIGGTVEVHADRSVPRLTVTGH
jgi:muramoyltetrapeptide carboxypeptidase LdcA involved in peptidoglycan recycling